MVTATLTKVSIELSQQTFPRGKYEFVAEEQSEFPHALSIDGAGVDSSMPVIQPGGGSQTVNVDLQPRHL